MVKIIRHFADGMSRIDPDADDITFTAEEVARGMRWTFVGSVPRLPDFLHHEPMSLITASGTTDDGQWQVTVGDEGITPYAGTESLEKYVERTVELVLAASTRSAPAPPPASAVPTLDVFGVVAPLMRSVADPPQNGGSYVKVELIDELEQLEGVGWDLTKLVAMLRELNDNVAAGNPYASLALCRAIIDHVPPIFGQAMFSAVVSQVSMSRTDKQHLKLLADNRCVSDDVLHRHVSQQPDLIEMQDVPQRLGIGTLVRLVVEKLK
jgi:hypothetical protein